MPDPSLEPGAAPGTAAEGVPRWPARVQARWELLPANLRGGLWYLAGAALLSVMLALIKLAGQSLHVTEILFFRQLTMAAVAAPVLWHGFPGALRTARPDLQVARILLAFGAMTLGFSAVIHLPLAVATTLGFTKTFFMTVAGMFLLGEIVRARRWAALAAGFAGVLVILWPHGSGEFSLYGLASIGSAAMVALVLVLIRRLSRVDRPVTILAWQAIGVGVLMFVPMLFFWRTPTPGEAGLLLAIGLVSAAGQYINILALRAGETSALAPLDFSRLVFALLLGFAIFAEWPEPRTFLGAGVIVGAAIYTLHRERRTGRAAG
ncbi:MAG TPA: DMT family transporter [Thermohalobaculum sp.]|nr:DMT family transporter [Thermohalobaculum sp.]